MAWTTDSWEDPSATAISTSLTCATDLQEAAKPEEHIAARHVCSAGIAHSPQYSTGVESSCIPAPSVELAHPLPSEVLNGLGLYVEEHVWYNGSLRKKAATLRRFNGNIPLPHYARFRDICKQFNEPLVKYLKERNLQLGRATVDLFLLGQTAYDAKPAVLLCCNKQIAKQVLAFFRQPWVKLLTEPHESHGFPDFKVYVKPGLPPLTAKQIHAVVGGMLDKDRRSRFIYVRNDEGWSMSTIGGMLDVVYDDRIERLALTVGHVIPHYDNSTQSKLLDSHVEAIRPLEDWQSVLQERWRSRVSPYNLRKSYLDEERIRKRRWGYEKTRIGDANDDLETEMSPFGSKPSGVRRLAAFLDRHDVGWNSENDEILLSPDMGVPGESWTSSSSESDCDTSDIEDDCEVGNAAILKSNELKQTIPAIIPPGPEMPSFVKYLSGDADEPDLDFALISTWPLDRHNKAGCRLSIFDLSFGDVARYVSSGSNISVFLVSALDIGESSDKIWKRGQLLPATSFCSNHGMQFVEVYKVAFDSENAIEMGDSGSWVVVKDANCDVWKVLGHVVSVDLFGNAYVVPMSSIFEQMKQVHGAEEVRFTSARSTLTDSRRECSLRSRIQKPEKPAHNEKGLGDDHIFEGFDFHDLVVKSLTSMKYVDSDASSVSSVCDGTFGTPEQGLDDQPIIDT